MPWKQELQQKQQSEQQKKKKFQKNTDNLKQSTLQSFCPGAAPPQKKGKNLFDVKKGENKKVEEDEEIDDEKQYSNVMMVKNVETIKLDKLTEKVQAILINPKWRPLEDLKIPDKKLSKDS